MQRGRRNDLATTMRKHYIKQARVVGDEMKRAVVEILRALIDDEFTIRKGGYGSFVSPSNEFRKSFGHRFGHIIDIVSKWLTFKEEARQAAYHGSWVDGRSWVDGAPCPGSIFSFRINIFLDHPKSPHGPHLNMHYDIRRDDRSFSSYSLNLPLWSHQYAQTPKQKSKLKEFLNVLLQNHLYCNFPLP
jgi:hypothetical protein